MNIYDIKNEEQYTQFYNKIQSPQVDGTKKYMGVMFPKDYKAFLDLRSSYEKGNSKATSNNEDNDYVFQNNDNEEKPIDADTKEDSEENSKIFKKKKK